MMEAKDDVEFGDVEVLEHDGLMLWCRIAGRIVAVPPLRPLGNSGQGNGRSGKARLASRGRRESRLDPAPLSAAPAARSSRSFRPGDARHAE